MIEQRAEQIRRRQEQEWFERFTNGKLVDYLQGSGDFPYSYTRNLLADNYRYEQNRKFLIYKFWRISSRYGLDTCLLLREAFSKLYKRDKYALLASLKELVRTIKSEYMVDIKNGEKPPVEVLAQLNAIAAEYYEELRQCTRDDFQLDDDYNKYRDKLGDGLVCVDYFKSNIEENIAFLQDVLQ
ncbi:hypothetical protein KP803_20885 [Vibrio sp. ZSDE26]|uniref:Uncharacterized protein n=1 Tax=Vibrio amylolyticus TaxID=2847292 RepID=A0A9X2BNA1_9VIBR|nr:hypothetical protein [Vibrio amylolyticus]MCK6265718.1 hypothetical protein [Vibrio amylolyticus]